MVLDRGKELGRFETKLKVIRMRPCPTADLVGENYESRKSA